jgi:hypothetical protein
MQYQIKNIHRKLSDMYWTHSSLRNIPVQADGGQTGSSDGNNVYHQQTVPSEILQLMYQ